eukprot:Em0019g31a
MSAWKFLHAQGILVEALYDELWKTDFPDCEVKPQVFADLLDHFLLIAEIRQTSIPIPSTHGKTYFMPCVLPIAQMMQWWPYHDAVLTACSMHLTFSSIWKSTADQQFWLKIPTIPDNLEGVLYEDEIKVLLQEINEEEFVKLSKALEMKQSASECFDDKVNPLVTENDLVKCSGYIADDADLSTLAVRLGIPLDSTLILKIRPGFAYCSGGSSSNHMLTKRP